ncbi:MAG TPA: DUF1700 domain-containing protein [Terriglobales bacterium]|nr:DUF1700 domain-containing protein [Terriglobales bacterium]
MCDEAQQRIEAYLSRLQKRLRGLNREDVHEILEELRSHILDKAAAGGEVTAAGVDGALAAMGSPEGLASEYVADNLLTRAAVSRSPLRVLDSLFRWASLSVAGFFVLVGSILGYVLGAIFILWAALKPLHPRTAGLWVSRDSTGELTLSLRLGFGSVPAVGRDVLGWWVVPIGLLVGWGLVLLTTRFALWCAREYRRMHLPRRVEAH